MGNGDNGESESGQSQKGSQGSQSPEGQTPSSGDQSPSPSTPQGQAGGGQGTGGDGSQSPFTHPRLKGRSPEDIQRLVSTMEETIKDQGRQLSRAQQGQGQPQQPQQPRGQEPEGSGAQSEFTDDEFYDRPVETMREIIRRELRETARPLQEQVQELSQRDRMDTIRGRMRSRFADWDQVEPYIENIAQRRGLTLQQVLSDPGVAETVYWSVKGQLEAGVLGNNQQPQQPQNPQQPQPAQRGQPQSPQQPQQPQQPQGNQNMGRQPPPPQHRPSSSPMPQPGNEGGEGQLRDLTENEERLRREYGMSKREYLEWQEMDARDAVTGQRPEQG